MHMYTSYNIQYIHQFVGCIKMYLYNFRDKQCVSEQTKYVKQNRKSQEQTITFRKQTENNALWITDIQTYKQPSMYCLLYRYMYTNQRMNNKFREQAARQT